MPLAAYANTGMNAQAFSTTTPVSESGSSLGYPFSATSQYHCASQPRTKSMSPAPAPKREDEVDSEAAMSRNAVVTARAPR